MTDSFILIKITNQLKRIADALEEQNKIAKLKINLSKSEINSIDTTLPDYLGECISYGGTNGD